MKRFVLIPAVLSLAACAGTQARPEPIVTTVEVPVPVAQPCVPDTLKGPPEYVDTKKALTDAGPLNDLKAAAKRMQLLYAGRAQREARLNEIEPIIKGCPRGSSKK